jgi:catechol 2,3-dioxygenase
MTKSKLPADIRMGPVHLTVSDLERGIDYYRRAIGLQLIDRQGEEASLGTEESMLLRLVEVPGAKRAPGRTGLYHFALLLPSRQALGGALRNLVATQTRITGGADHLVSEAIYLDDPDGNGIEIYRDRPRESWTVREGMVQMDTLPLDFEGILNEPGGGETAAYALPAQTVMGHVHLHVSRLEEAVRFYREVVGFDLVLRFGGSAAFLSAGGYHHHLGANTWAGVGVPAPPEGSVGLRYYVVVLPDKGVLQALTGRLQPAKIAYESAATGLFVRDPAQNKIHFTYP